MTVSFSIPLLPPSVNLYKKPRRKSRQWYVDTKAKAFFAAVGYLGPKEMIVGEFYQVHLTFRFQRNNFLRGDLDNLLKVAVDSLVKNRIISDDRYIIRLLAYKCTAASREEEGTEFEILTV